MSNLTMAEQLDRPDNLMPRAGAAGRTEAPIVPKSTIGGRALVAIIAIMTFLSSFTTGGVMLMLGAASEWQSEVAREVTIQVRPVAGRDIEADVARAAEIVRATPGVTGVRPYTREESARLLEPWLGSGFAVEDLPVPRVIAVRMGGSTRPDIPALRTALAREIPGASLDDHRGWIDRMRAMTASAISIGIAVLVLMLVATVLSVTFATRGAMAANRPIIEVLHFIGATDRYIAGQFLRHFLTLGIKGGAAGGGVAILLFAIVGFLGNNIVGTAGGDQAAALFGSFAIGVSGYIVIVLQILLIAGVAAVTAREVVNRTLRSIG
jgi:cell division transport system permease protein